MSDSKSSAQGFDRRSAFTAMGGVLGGAVVVGLAGASPAMAATTFTSVSSYAALKALPQTTPMDPVVVLGVNTPGDGGAGLFWFEAGAPASADDGGTVLASTAASGVWRRILEDPDTLNPRWFGCKADGASDDTAAFQKAVNAAVRSRRTLRLPSATLLLTGAITVPTDTAVRHLAVVGHGPQESQLLLRNSGSLNFDLGTVNEFNSAHLVFRGVGLRCDSAATVTALKVTFGYTYGATPQTSIIEDIEVTGVNDNTGPKVAVHLVGANGLRMRGARIQGVRINPAAATQGVLIQGTSTPDVIPSELYVSDVNVYFVSTAFHIDGVTGTRIEGVHLDRCAVVLCQVGVGAYATTTSLAPWIKVDSCHFHTWIYGIEIQNYVNYVLTNNLIYGNGPTSPGYIGMRLVQNAAAGTGGLGMASIVSNNILQWVGGAVGPKNGIVVFGSAGSPDAVLVTNNTLNSFDTGIWLASGSENVAVPATNYFRGNANKVVNQGVGNTVVTPLLT